MKKMFFRLMAILVCLSLLCVFVACDETPENPQEGTSEETPGGSQGVGQETEEDRGISQEKWELMLDEANFNNYTLELKGNMTAYLNGEKQEGSEGTHEIYRITEDALEITLILDETPVHSMVLYGDDAKVTKTELSQIFLAILSEYDKFVYDSEKKEYTIKDTVINVDITTIVDGALSDEKIPVEIEVKNGTATVSDNGKVAKLVCDYSQTMHMGETVIQVKGITEWIFSDYGTTVISADSSTAE